MPTTRRGQTSSVPSHSGSASNYRGDTEGSQADERSETMMLTDRHLGTNVNQTLHDLDGRRHASPDRAAKRRRTEASERDSTTLDPLPGSFTASDTQAASEQISSDDIHPSLRELHAQLKVYADHDVPGSENGTAPAETFGQLDPNMTKAISDIIDHSERFEQYYALGAADDDGLLGSKGLILAKTGSRMKVESLPILDNLVKNISSSHPTFHRLLTHTPSLLRYCLRLQNRLIKRSSH